MDVIHYLDTYRVMARELAITMIFDVPKATGITATAGIGTNLYLYKETMDIGVKHIPADQNGMRIAELDEGQKAALDMQLQMLESLEPDIPEADFTISCRTDARREAGM